MDKDYHRKWRIQRRTQGLCRQCPEPIASNSTCYCSTCLEKHRLANKERWAKKRYKSKNVDKNKIRFSSIKRRAKDYGIAFEIERDEFCGWIAGNDKVCHYCGVTEDKLKSLGRSKSMLTVDRKDNTQGYSLDNMCLACFRCNNLKSNFFSESDWLFIARRFIVPRLDEYHASKA